MADLLPIDEIKSDFISSLEKHNTLILTAPPGAGKSTRLPLWLLSLDFLSSQKIYLLQPRRIAAKNIACFLSQQLGEPVGKTVGYRLKNESKISTETRLEVITEGILTQIIQHDPELTDCGLVILDEFHERSLQGDLAFALTRDAQQGLRDDLKIVIMSATLATKSLGEKLPDAVALESEGRSYPVDVEYIPSINKLRNSDRFAAANQWREHALKVIAEQSNSHSGSILVFLPGVADIKYLNEQLQTLVPDSILLAPLYGELSIVEQQKAIAPPANGQHKLVLATNIAETSLTIEGVNLVIDCGLEKVAIYDAKTLTNKLQQQTISKASSIQRAGRAGRLMPGKCIRLFSKENYDRRDENGTSEIQQADLLPFVIEAARWGIKQLSELPLIELPSPVKEQQAWSELALLSIVNDKHQLTKHGALVANLPTHPRFAHMIVKAQSLQTQLNERGLFRLACLITAVLEERDVYSREQARFDCNLVHRLESLLHAEGGRKVNRMLSDRIFKQANHLIKGNRKENKVVFKDSLPLQYTGLLLALAYPERLSKFRGGNGGQSGDYLTRSGKGVSMNEEDALLGEIYITAGQIGQFIYNNQTKTIVQLAATIDIEQLIELGIVTPTREVVTDYDNQKDRIVAKTVTRIDALVLSEVSTIDKLSSEDIAKMWDVELKKIGLSFLSLNEEVKGLLNRWQWICAHRSDLMFPIVNEESLLKQTDTWFTPFVGNIKNKKQLNKCNFLDMLLGLLTYQQQQVLKTVAPTHFVGPTGRRCAIRYSDEKSPIVSLPMQELYGLSITPSVGMVSNTDVKHAIPLILEILSPAKRPIQVTQDLIAFWKGSYKAVQKDMKSQYPRHYWPDDPLNAKATNKTKRHIKE
jgi:ATP-dependent helicase HrpB